MKHGKYWQRFRRQGSTRERENLRHMENRVQEMYDNQLDPPFIEDNLRYYTNFNF